MPPQQQSRLVTTSHNSANGAAQIMGKEGLEVLENLQDLEDLEDFFPLTIRRLLAAWPRTRNRKMRHDGKDLALNDQGVCS